MDFDSHPAARREHSGGNSGEAAWPASVPLLYAYRLAESAGHCFRLPRHFGLHGRHIPMLLALAALVHSFELPGMFSALRGRPAGPTVYR